MRLRKNGLWIAVVLMLAVLVALGSALAEDAAGMTDPNRKAVLKEERIANQLLDGPVRGYTIDESVVKLTQAAAPSLGGTGTWSITCNGPDGSAVREMSVSLMTRDYDPDNYTTVYRKDEIMSTYTSCPFVSAGDYSLTVFVTFENGAQYAAEALFSIMDDDAHTSLTEKIVKVVTDCRGEDEWHTALNLHDWLTNHAYYDGNYEYYGADGVLLRGYGVCDSYSKAYLLLCRAANIPVSRVTGWAGENHAWNAIQIDGEWYHVDATWDDPYVKGSTAAVSGYENHEYFCLNDALISLDHENDLAEFNEECNAITANYTMQDTGRNWSHLGNYLVAVEDGAITGLKGTYSEQIQEKLNDEAFIVPCEDLYYDVNFETETHFICCATHANNMSAKRGWIMLADVMSREWNAEVSYDPEANWFTNCDHNWQDGICSVCGLESPYLLDFPEFSLNNYVFHKGEKVILTLEKTEHASTYSIRVYSVRDNTEYNTATLTDDDFGTEGIKEIRIPTDEIVTGDYCCAEVAVSANRYIGRNKSISFSVTGPGTASIGISAPENYVKKRSPAVTDGLRITVKPTLQMKDAVAQDWSITVLDGTKQIYTAGRQTGKSFTETLLIPDVVLTAGKTYTFSLSLLYEGFERYNSTSYSFAVQNVSADSLYYEVSSFMTPSGQKQALYISANGEIPDYTADEPAPWSTYKDSTDKIVLNGDLTRIGDYAFAGFSKDGLRIDFNQGGKPTISETAFSGCENVICRYYVDNTTWTTGYDADNLSWIYLPVNTGGSFDGNTAHFDYVNGGWALTLFNNETTWRDRYPMTAAQAKETAWGKYKEIDFYSVPATAADQSLYTGWEAVQTIRVQNGCAGTLNIELPAQNTVSVIEINSRLATVNISNGRSGSLYRMKCGGGTVTYNGDIQNLTLENTEKKTSSVKVTGNIESLNFNDATADRPWKGSMILNGTIQSGSVLGKTLLEIPGAGTREFSLSTYTFSDITKENGTVIAEGILKVPSTQVQVSLDMYRPEYHFTDLDNYRMISLLLNPKDEYKAIIGTNSVRCDNLNITTDQIIYGPDTDLTFQMAARNGKLILNGREEGGTLKGIHRIYCMHGQVEINCPVDSITVSNGSNFTEGVDLTLNNEVGSLTVQTLNQGTITLGRGGKVTEGMWNRRSLADRYFGPVTAPVTLFSEGGLHAMSWKFGETLQSLLPTDEAIAAAAGLEEGVLAAAEVSQSSEEALNTNERTALNDFMTENGVTLAAVFDATITSYTLDENGGAIQGSNISSLGEPVSFAVSNTAGESYVVRLHEEDGTMMAVQVSEPTVETAVPFESDRFSKYALVTYGEKTWDYVYEEQEKLLRITGSGSLTLHGTAPWIANNYDIDRVLISEEITSIGANIFAGLKDGVRIDFCQTTIPVIDAGAFGSTKAVCRYTSSNNSWKTAPVIAGVSWVWMPTFNMQAAGTFSSLSYDETNGWKVTVLADQQPYTGMPAATAHEVLLYCYDLVLNDIPDDLTAVIGDMEDQPWMLTLTYDGDDAPYLTLTSDSVDLPCEILLASPDLSLEVRDSREEGLYKLEVQSGEINYIGHVQTLILANTAHGRSGDVNVTGTVGEVNYYNDQSSKPFCGTLIVTGSVQKGIVYGGSTQTMVIPHICDAYPLSTSGANQTFNELADLMNEVVINTSRNPAVTNKASLTEVPAPTIDQFDLRYMFVGNDDLLKLTPLEGSGLGSQPIKININEYSNNFRQNLTDNIIWSGRTDIHVSLQEGSDPIELTGKDGVGFREFSAGGYSTVTVKCPVDRVQLQPDPKDFGTLNLIFEDEISEAYLQPNNINLNITLKNGATILGGRWKQMLRDYRDFGAYGTKAGETLKLVENSTLNVMSRTDHEILSAILPSDATVAAAAGKDHAMVTLTEEDVKSLSDVEMNALGAVACGDGESLSVETDQIISVFDVSVNEYTVDSNGVAVIGVPVVSLSEEIPVTVSNESDEDDAFVVRLHQEGSRIIADKLDVTDQNGGKQFTSDLFSTYLLVSPNALPTDTVTVDIIGDRIALSGQNYSFALSNLSSYARYDLSVYDLDHNSGEAGEYVPPVFTATESLNGAESLTFTIPAVALTAGHSYQIWASAYGSDDYYNPAAKGSLVFYVYKQVAKPAVKLSTDWTEIRTAETKWVKIKVPEGTTAVRIWNGEGWSAASVSPNKLVIDFPWQYGESGTVRICAMATKAKDPWAQGASWNLTSNVITVNVTQSEEVVGGFSVIPPSVDLKKVYRGQMLPLTVNVDPEVDFSEYGGCAVQTIIRERNGSQPIWWDQDWDMDFPYAVSVPTNYLPVYDEPQRLELVVRACAVGHKWWESQPISFTYYDASVITFYACNDEWDMATQPATGEETVLMENPFAYPGRHFIGWAETEGGPKVYDDGDTIEVTEDLELYALWKLNTIYFSLDVIDSTLPNALINVQGGRITGSAGYVDAAHEWVERQIECTGASNFSGVGCTGVWLLAEPDVNYTFVGWYSGEVLSLSDQTLKPIELLSTDPSYHFEISGENEWKGFCAVFRANFSLPDFTLPSAMTTIAPNAFEGIHAASVSVSAQCTAIGAKAFKDCTELKKIWMPKNCDIAEDAFSGCSNFIIYAPADGTTQAWAEEYMKTHETVIFYAQEWRP